MIVGRLLSFIMNNTEKSKKYGKLLICIYICFFAAFAAVSAYIALSCDRPSFKDEMYGSAAPFSSGWTLDGGSSVDISGLGKLDIPAGEEFGVFACLPSPCGQSLFFRSKNIFYSVFIDGEEVYSPEAPQNIFYTDSFGTRWNCIPLDGYAGKTVEIRITKSYDNSGSIDNIYIGNPGGIVLKIIEDRAAALLTCILLMFIGILLILADIPVNIQSKKNHELLYLGLFALNISVWCLSETNLVQFYFYDSRLMQTISCTILMLIPVPMILYLDSAFGLTWKWLSPLFCIISESEIILCWTLHFLKISDIHGTLFLSHIMLGISAVIMFSVNIRNTFTKRAGNSPMIYRILRGSGFICLSVATLIDIIRYYGSGSDDNAMFVRIGMLVYIACYGISSLENTINAVKMGVKADIISHLAYSDGLTGVGNRTAFTEHLSELENGENGPIGIIMFDVNDLKLTNDTYGHHVGDNMLIKSADVIRDSFEPCGGKCYRIGGDEFAVILEGNGIQEKYENCLKNFNENIDKYNALPDKEFDLSIAQGFAGYDGGKDKCSVTEVYKAADVKMYENKKKIKAERKASAAV